MDGLYGYNDVQENIAFFLLEKTGSLYGSFVGFIDIPIQGKLFGKVVNCGKFSLNGDSLMPENRIIIHSKHALQRMFDRKISLANVMKIVTGGTLIYTGTGTYKYNEEKFRNLGFVDGVPVHVVYSVDKDTMIKTVVTVIIPDADEWEEGFTKLKRSRWNSVTFDN